jgi:glycosyltransferase involved in cell wall biosynthesis
MKKYWRVEILTTCATDFTTWKNELPAGAGEVNGLTVHRFAVDQERDPEAFRQLCDHVLSGPTSPEKQEEWMRAQGPYSTALFDFIRDSKRNYELFVFFGYLYATTYFGIPLVKERAVLVPAAHDEPMLRLPIYGSVFAAARYVLWLTMEERRLVQRICGLELPGEICGSGPGTLPVERLDTIDLKRPYLIYVGRIDHPKGCGELLLFFSHSSQLPDLHLYLVGEPMMDIPRDARIHALGRLKEGNKNWLLSQAVALVMPSPYESLSLVLLESWRFGVPVLVNGRCQVLKGQCARSGGGIAYTDHRSFIGGAKALVESPGYRATLGIRGLRYVEKTYSWPEIEHSYLRAFQTAAR